MSQIKRRQIADIHKYWMDDSGHLRIQVKIKRGNIVQRLPVGRVGLRLAQVDFKSKIFLLRRILILEIKRLGVSSYEYFIKIFKK